MRLDPTYLAYITKEQMRVLTAVQMGMRNHQFVPVHLIERISHLKRSNAYTVLRLLLKNQLVTHVQKQYDGYKLTYLGYDYLALSVFMKRGHIKSIIGKMGVGKESDIYKCIGSTGEEIVLKFARLGRISFRNIKNKRDYIKYRTNYNWLYLSRLASIKEFIFMQLLYKNGYPTPVPIDSNRHGVLMSLCDGFPLCQIKQLQNPKFVFDQCFDIINRLAQDGMIHSDFNQFNLIVNNDMKVTMIDFPQMVSTSHRNAEFYFDRDVECIHTFFERRFDYTQEDTLDLKDIPKQRMLDIEVKASGFVQQELNQDLDDLDVLEQYHRLLHENLENYGEKNESGDENEEEKDENEEGDEGSQNEEGNDSEDIDQEFQKLEKEEGEQSSDGEEKNDGSFSDSDDGNQENKKNKNLVVDLENEINQLDQEDGQENKKLEPETQVQKSQNKEKKSNFILEKLLPEGEDQKVENNDSTSQKSFENSKNKKIDTNRLAKDIVKEQNQQKLQQKFKVQKRVNQHNDQKVQQSDLVY